MHADELSLQLRTARRPPRRKRRASLAEMGCVERSEESGSENGGGLRMG
jgi:hypothetical protein